MNGSRHFAVTACILALLAAAVPAPVRALDVEALERRMAAMEAELQALREELAEAKRQAAETERDAVLNVKWSGAPEISSPDGRFAAKLRGRILADAAFVDQDEAVTGVPDVDATEFRAARLGIEGVLWSDFKYKFETDFAGNDVDVKDAYLQYAGWPVALTVGQFKTPNSLEEQTSSRYLPLMERASVTDAFGLARQLGIGMYHAASNWTAAAGVFRGSVDDGARDQGHTLAGRVTFAPVNGERTAVHLGAHARQRKRGDDQGLLRYRQRPHQHLADRFIDTGAIADEDTLLGVEAAGVFGPFSLQGEYMRLKADIAGDENPTFDGWYVDANWFLTGESRPYGKGSFGRVKVNNPVFSGGAGAWQLALRYDTVNLSDNDIIGGEQNSWIAGVNWHLNNHVRLMLNYSRSDIDGGANDDAKIKAVGLRAQVDW